jgi:hypothetical protein
MYEADRTSLKLPKPVLEDRRIGEQATEERVLVVEPDRVVQSRGLELIVNLLVPAMLTRTQVQLGIEAEKIRPSLHRTRQDKDREQWAQTNDT